MSQSNEEEKFSRISFNTINSHVLNTDRPAIRPTQDYANSQIHPINERSFRMDRLTKSEAKNM